MYMTSVAIINVGIVQVEEIQSSLTKWTLRNEVDRTHGR